MTQLNAINTVVDYVRSVYPHGVNAENSPIPVALKALEARAEILRARAARNRKSALNPVCVFCGKPATCFGAYEHEGAKEHGEETYACDDCCGHGNEDGHCQRLTHLKL